MSEALPGFEDIVKQLETAKKQAKYKIVNIKVVEGLLGRNCLEIVCIADGIMFSFTRYPKEKHWFCDSAFGEKDMYPYFCHGTGARSGLNKQTPTEKCEMLFNEEVEKWRETILQKKP